MAAAAPPKPPAAKGKGLNAKGIGGLPMWAVIGIGVVGLFVVYRVYEAYKANQTAAAATSPTAATPVDTSGGASGDTGAAATPDLAPFEDLATALNGLTGILGAGGTSGNGFGIGTGSDLSGVGTQTTTAGTVVGADGSLQPDSSQGTGPQGVYTGPHATPVGTQTPSPARQKADNVTTGPLAPGQKSIGAPIPTAAQIIPNANAFGGIASNVVNAAGTRVITYNSGRIVEQAKGKTPYVAKK